MPLPQAPEARPFYQSARQRFEDAEILLAAKRTTGAIYLAGYSVECMLKALILAATPARRRGAIVESFRGARAHDFDWLKGEYAQAGGAAMPAEVVRAFALVTRWSTLLRYTAGAAKLADAKAFLQAVTRITEWADGRM